MNRRAWLAALVLASACDRVLGLGAITPPYVSSGGAGTLAAGGGHTCFIDMHGNLWCWGENDAGQLGVGATVPELDMPTQVPDSVWTAVSAYANHTCGLQTDHTLWCWGGNDDGELATGDQMPRTMPAQVAGTWQTVATGRYHTCAIDDRDALWCWGFDGDGELGDGGSTMQTSPVQVADSVAAVTAGTNHTCAIHRDGTLACWGRNSNAQLGTGSTTSSSTPVTVGSETWSAVAAGRLHTCGITASHHLRCWGTSVSGQLGNPNTSGAAVPTPVLIGGADLATWTAVASDEDHTCAWDAQGTAYCFGDSSHGELLVAGVAANVTPLAFPGAWSALAVGVHHVCGLAGDGTVQCAGGDGWGQLGDSPPATLAPPAGSGTWGTVFAGGGETCALDPTSHASCGGSNYYGQLGDGTRTSRAILMPVMEPGTWSQFAVGEVHACGISNSQLYCWGDNEADQLGIGPSGPVFAPTLVTLPAQSKGVIGSYHTCEIDSNNQLYCWGSNARGELGDGTTTTRDTPGAPVGGTATWLQVATGIEFTCALDSKGLAWCWGDNSLGQLGKAVGAMSAAPVPLGATQYMRIFVGGHHACALDTSNQAWCWGYNGEGQLGTGATAGYLAVPTLISTQRWYTMQLGELHTCALDNSGTRKLWCWGDDRRGQLGLGNPMRSSVLRPTEVGTDTWDFLAAGAFHTCGLRAGALACWGSDDDGQLLDGAGWKPQLVTVPVGP